MPFPDVVTTAARAALADVRFTPYWLDQPSRPAARPALVGDVEADLVVIGGGILKRLRGQIALITQMQHHRRQGPPQAGL